MFSVFYVAKERIVYNGVYCTMASWRRSLNWTIYRHKHYFTNRVLKRRYYALKKWEPLHEECKAKYLLQFLPFSAFSFKTVACTIRGVHPQKHFPLFLDFPFFDSPGKFP